MESERRLDFGNARCLLPASPDAFRCQSSTVFLHGFNRRTGPELEESEKVAMGRDGFQCQLCGSASVSVPARLEQDSEVTCAKCGCVLSSWDEYKRKIGSVLRDATPGRRPTISDPIDW